MCHQLVSNYTYPHHSSLCCKLQHAGPISRWHLSPLPLVNLQPTIGSLPTISYLMKNFCSRILEFPVVVFYQERVLHLDAISIYYPPVADLRSIDLNSVEHNIFLNEHVRYKNQVILFDCVFSLSKYAPKSCF